MSGVVPERKREPATHSALGGLGVLCSEQRTGMPERIQLSRAKGWRMPENTVKVDRSTQWGNPWTVENSGRIDPVLRFACETAPLMDLSPLRGKNLACWCKPGASCHADVLLDLANQEQQ